MDAVSTASPLAPHGSFCFRQAPSPSQNSHLVPHKHPAPPSPPPTKSHLSVTTQNKGRPPYQLRSASPEEISSEITEDSKFVPLNAEDPIYGPPVLLLVGFEANETAKIQQLLKDLDGEFLKVILCTDDMMSLTVWDAMHVRQQNLEAFQRAESLPRICILSGLSGEEMMMFIDAFPETGLEPAVFAAMVPNSANKQLGEVIEEIMGDHEMLSAKQSG